MASIKSALKNKTSYTNKLGTTIPYKDLAKMKRANDMLNYYGKVLGIKTSQERIVIGSLTSNYAGRLSRLEVSKQVLEYARLRTINPKTLKTKTAVSKWQRAKRWYEGKLNKAFDGARLNITEEAIKNFREGKEALRIGNIYNFSQNLRKSIDSNFSELIGEDIAKRLGEFIDGMDIYEIHRLAKDNPDLLSFIYFDPAYVSSRFEQLIEKLEETTGRKVFTAEQQSTAVDNIDNWTIEGALNPNLGDY